MTKKRYRGALIGFGQVAEKAHAPALRQTPDLEIAAVVDASAQRRNAAAGQFPDIKTYDSLETLLAAEKNIDFVDIATPPSAHGAQVLAALKAGLHVLCEKPVSLDLEQFASIKRESAAADLAVWTMHNWAFSPQWRKILSLVDGGELGALRHVELHVLRTRPAAAAQANNWRSDAAVAGGGILVDHGWHNFYLLHRVLKGAPTRVTGRLGGAKKGSVEDEATVYLEYPDATALLHLSWRSPLRSNTALFLGSKALLKLEDGHLTLHGADGTEERFEFPEKLSAGSSHPEWTAGLLGEFAAAIARPRDRPHNLEEAGFCLNMINRVYASVHVGRNPLREALTKPREHQRTP
jgi:predicted dehydrogenase